MKLTLRISSFQRGYRTTGMSGSQQPDYSAQGSNSSAQDSNSSAQDSNSSSVNSNKPWVFSSKTLWNRVQSSVPSMPTWKPTSQEHLERTEKQLLDGQLSSGYSSCHVPISDDTVMRTVILEPKAPPPLDMERPPLVMLHGFGAGLVQYFKNFDSLHQNRRLLAPDLPGFGRSTRVQFPKDSVRAERQFVDSIEKWRQQMGLENFVLLGHSMGAFLATAYAIKHPHRVRHLVLVDPWGFPSGPTEEEIDKMSTRFQRFTWKMFVNTKPFAVVRAAGPWGPDLVKNVRKDLVSIFGETYMEYIYHCNAQNPTGEDAYVNMQYYYCWAQRPMLDRMKLQLHPRVPITVISGARTWLDAVNRKRLGKTADLIREARPLTSYMKIEVVEDAGHHPYAEKPEEFNRMVLNVLDTVDTGADGGSSDSWSSVLGNRSGGGIQDDLKL